MLTAGKACLILALASCLYGIGASLYGARRGRREWVASGHRAVYAVAGTTALAFVILQAAFLRRPRIREGDKVFADAQLTAEQRDAFLGQALVALTRSYANNPPPATFRLIVSPMVTAIWIGALIALAGGLLALWPRRRRPEYALYAARVGSEVRLPTRDRVTA